MGLDMYLSARKRVRGWDHSSEPEKKVFEQVAQAVGIEPCEASPHFYVSACVGYWRKANAIHKWFVDNVQNGDDNCNRSHVSRENLIALRDLCHEVLAVAKTKPGQIHVSTTYSGGVKTENYEPGEVIENAEEVAALLPTQSGCFFGGTDYNKYYLQDVKETAELIDRILADKVLDDCDFEYRASW